MRLRLGVLLPLLLLVPAPAGAQALPPQCMRDGETVVARSDGAVALERERRGGAQQWTICDPMTGRRQGLGGSSYSKFGASIGFGPFAAGGTKVAFVYSYADRYGGEERAVVVDVREDLPALGVGVSDGVALPEADPAVLRDRRVAFARELAVDPTGRIAFRTERAVYVLDPDGSARQVDRGAAGSLRALAVTGDRITWRHAGEDRSAPLTLPPDACRPPAGAPVQAFEEVVLVAGSHGGPACLRASGQGFMPVTGRSLQVAGTLVAGQRKGHATVTDLATGAPVGRPVAVQDERWLLAPGGTIVTVGRRQVVAHRPDGARVPLGATPRRIGPMLIDPVLERVVLGRGRRTVLLPLVPSCARRGEDVVGRGEGMTVIADRTREGNRRYRRYTLCEEVTGARKVLLLAADDSDGGSNAQAFAFSGRLIAWSETSSAKGASDSRIVVRDLDALDAEQPVRTVGIRVGADEIALTPDARLVAAALGPELVVADEHGQRVVDHAIAGTLNDLAFAGDILTWRHGGQARRTTVPLRANCVPPKDVVAVEQRADAAAGWRARDFDLDRATPMVCRFAGGGWTELPGEGLAQVAGAYAASVMRNAAGAREVVVRDLATLAPVGTPVPLAREGAWALRSDGAVIARDAHGLALHRLDGRVVTWQPLDIPVSFAVDEVAGHLVWHPYNAMPESSPLPSGA